MKKKQKIGEKVG